MDSVSNKAKDLGDAVVDRETEQGTGGTIERLLASSMLVACVRCGSSGTYRGSPDKINEAAKVFYEIHERCWERKKTDQSK